MRFAHPGISEHNLAAHFEYLCLTNGAQRLAYVPVVASGFVSFLFKQSNLTIPSSANALVIHYVSNNQVIQPEELVLVDAGCEYK